VNLGTSRYQKISILKFTGAKDDGSGGDNWSCKTCKVPVKMSPLTNRHPAFLRLDALPVAQPTVSEHCYYYENIFVDRRI